MKFIIFFLFLIIHLKSHAQISYDEGYFITNDGIRTKCLIKNINWEDHHTTFEYKFSENSELKKASIASVKEFGINNTVKYQRFTLNIDQSGVFLNEPSPTKNPDAKKETLFLRVLVEGKASLYTYKGLNHFFYSIDGGPIIQLIHKRYFKTKNKMAKSNMYKQQLWDHVKCGTITMKNVRAIAYIKKDLVKYFIAYNECKNAAVTNYKTKIQIERPSLKIKPGLHLSQLSVQNTTITSRSVDFERLPGLRLGIEVEFQIPFNRKKWSVFIDPAYQSYQSETDLNTQSVRVDYQSFELPIGIRYYVFLGSQSKFFINAAYIFDFERPITVDYETSADIEDIETSSTVGLGVGYQYNRYSIEFRYKTENDFLTGDSRWNMQYNSLAIVFGYRIF